MTRKTPELFAAGARRPLTVSAPTGQFDVVPILPAPPSGWDGPAMGQWELEDAVIVDCHPFDEINLVLEGELTVRTRDGEVVAGVGDAVRVSAGTPAEYRSRGHRSRMLYVYGPNPEGSSSEMYSRLPT